ncbi:MAG: M50 family metallopeptidase [Pirellulales bacterium]
MKRFHQAMLIASAILASWLGMQAVHELGHVLGALLTGGEVNQIVLHPLTISRTDLGLNPQPLLVVWAGPAFGVLFPLALWSAAAAVKFPGLFVIRFFAGFCLVANGAYIALGSWSQIGDCGEMLRHGSPIWRLWLFGGITIPLGFWLWHRQGAGFGFGSANGEVNLRVAYITFATALLLIVLGLAVGGT